MSLTRAFSGQFVINAMSAFGRMGVMVVVARALGPSDLGLASTVFNLTALAVLVSSLGAEVSVPLALRRGGGGIAGLESTRLAALLLAIDGISAMLLALALCWWSEPIAVGLFAGEVPARLVVIAAAAIVPTVLSTVWVVFARAEGVIDEVERTLLVGNVASLISQAIGALAYGLEGYVTGTVLGAVASLASRAYWLRGTHPQFGHRPVSSRWGYSLGEIFPILLRGWSHALVGFLNQGFRMTLRALALQLSSTRALGLWSAAFGASAATLGLVQNSLYDVYLPRLLSGKGADDEGSHALVVYWVPFVTASTVALQLALPPAILFVFGVRFEGIERILTWQLAGDGIRATAWPVLLPLLSGRRYLLLVVVEALSATIGIAIYVAAATHLDSALPIAYLGYAMCYMAVAAMVLGRRGASGGSRLRVGAIVAAAAAVLVIPVMR